MNASERVKVEETKIAYIVFSDFLEEKIKKVDIFSTSSR